jgi:ligand-binding sensor domain-containing protein/signal transduction histidine kinase
MSLAGTTLCLSSKRKWSILLLLTATLFFQADDVAGQKRISRPAYVHSNVFTTEHGLSQNNVSNITKDLNGFIWVGTADGLNRFDGYSFVHFSHSDSDSVSLSNDVIRNLLVDSKGRLWVGTYNGLNLYDSETETFRNFLTNTSNGDAISHNTILYLLEDRNHQLWVGTFWGLNKIDLETLTITRYYSHADGTGLSDNAVNTLLEDRNGKIWACTGKGIDIIGPQGVEKTIPQSEAPDGLTSSTIANIVQDSKGAIYLGTIGSGLLRLEDENDRTFEYFVHDPNTPSLGSNIIGSVAVDRNDVLIVGTDGAGLFRRERNGEFTHMLDRKNKSLENGSVQRIFIDEENNYWFGLFGVGLAFIPGDPPRLEHYQFFDVNMERLGKNSVLALAEDQNKKIWIGTDGGGLYKFDPETKHFTSYLHSPVNKNSLSTNVVKSLLVDDKNNLYIGTYAAGLNYLDTRTNTFSRYLHNPNDTTSISTNHVWSLLQDRDKRIFVGLLGGLNEFIPQRKAFSRLTISGQNPVTTNTASVFSMQEDRNGNVWMGTRLAGIHRYDPTTRSFKSFLNIPGNPSSFPTNEILELGIDSEGNILVGTDSKGLIRFNPEKFTFAQVVAEYRESNVPSVLEDDSAHLWFTSFDGLHRYNPNTGALYDYTMADGLQGLQFNEGARLKSSAGDYYFGGTNGLNVFRPEKMQEDYSRPNVLFTKLSLFHDVVRIKDKSGLLAKNISNTKEIVFQPDQNVFSIEFACIEYKFPKKNRYRYFLEGFDNHWNEIKENRTATYTNLPPGEYTLKVSATNGSGYWNEEAASIRLVVLARWHERFGVRAAALALLVILILGIIYIRIKFLIGQRRKLERLVKIRTATVEAQKEEIKDKNQMLEHANEEVTSVNEQLQKVNLNLEKVVEDRTQELRLTIKKLIETNESFNTFLYRSSHDLRGPITTMLGLAGLANLQNCQEELTPYFCNIENTATAMLRLLKRLNETGALFRAKPQVKIIPTVQFTQSILNQLGDFNKDNVVRVEIENKLGESFPGDPFLLSIIVVSLMENSIVFRKNLHPFVKCTLYSENRNMIIEVVDNGIGISPQVKDRIFDMFYRGSEKSVGNGLGLFMVKKVLDVLEGSIGIESNELTVVKVRIPMPDANSVTA